MPISLFKKKNTYMPINYIKDKVCFQIVRTI